LWALWFSPSPSSSALYSPCCSDGQRLVGGGLIGSRSFLPWAARSGWKTRLPPSLPNDVRKPTPQYLSALVLPAIRHQTSTFLLRNSVLLFRSSPRFLTARHSFLGAHHFLLDAPHALCGGQILLHGGHGERSSLSVQCPALPTNPDILPPFAYSGVVCPRSTECVFSQPSPHANTSRQQPTSLVCLFSVMCAASSLSLSVLHAITILIGYSQKDSANHALELLQSVLFPVLTMINPSRIATNGLIDHGAFDTFRLSL
jgi:hypothetical protein